MIMAKHPLGLFLPMAKAVSIVYFKHGLYIPNLQALDMEIKI